MNCFKLKTENIMFKNIKFLSLGHNNIGLKGVRLLAMAEFEKLDCLWLSNNS